MKNPFLLFGCCSLFAFGCGSIQDGTRELAADDMATALNGIRSGNTFKLKPGKLPF